MKMLLLTSNVKSKKTVVCVIKEIVELIKRYSPVHGKCSKLKPTEISDLKNRRNLKWEYTICLNDKFSFTFSDDK